MKATHGLLQHHSGLGEELPGLSVAKSFPIYQDHLSLGLLVWVHEGVSKEGRRGLVGERSARKGGGKGTRSGGREVSRLDLT